MAIVTRSARKDARLVCGPKVSDLASQAHRAHRHDVKQRLDSLVNSINSEVVPLKDVSFDNQPARKHMVTGWEIA